ncbi:Uncharacterised protein [Mycobacteroides abscessus subsp. abscessus]|nr:Uncharacterised protein [Mycobacteroides abscessus subsp. abscessus]
MSAQAGPVAERTIEQRRAVPQQNVTAIGSGQIEVEPKSLHQVGRGRVAEATEVVVADAAVGVNVRKRLLLGLTDVTVPAQVFDHQRQSGRVGRKCRGLGHGIQWVVPYPVGLLRYRIGSERHLEVGEVLAEDKDVTSRQPASGVDRPERAALCDDTKYVAPLGGR